MKWSEGSRRAFVIFSKTPRKHIFFIPNGDAKVRVGYAHKWEMMDAQNKERFWAEYNMGFYANKS